MFLAALSFSEQLHRALPPHSFLRGMKENFWRKVKLLLCSRLFILFFRGQPPSSINTWRLTLTYECPALACLVSCQIFLNSHSSLPFGFYFSLFYIHFLPSYSVARCIAGWLPLVSSSPSPFLLSTLLSSPICFLCLSALSILFPALLLAFQLFIRPVRCCRQAK